MANSSDSVKCGSFDAYSPKEMACRAEAIGFAKSNLGFFATFMLAVLAGAFIALGACFFAAVETGSSAGLGLTRLIGGICFSTGLILVVVGGAELFTGNVLIVIAFISGRVSFLRLMRNWAIVYLGNMVGALGTVALVYYADQWKMGAMATGVTAYSIAGAKMSLSFTTAFCSGVLCNVLVCLAVWLCYSARSTTDKILSILFPVAAFVTLGFEHSVANMYFIPYGLMLSKTAAFTGSPAAAPAIAKYPLSVCNLSNFLLGNLVPVTLGNIVGGAIMVGAVYWIVYLRGAKRDSGISALGLAREQASAEER